MSCVPTRENFSAYLDGALSGRAMQELQAHLESCGACAAEFNAWRGVQRVLSAAGAVKAPTDLGLRLRVAISHENARREGRWFRQLTARWENAVRPALLQAAGGLAGAVVMVGSMAIMIGVVAAPQAVLANDEPLGALTSPHFLYSAARQQPVTTAGDQTIVVQAQLNSLGRVYDYKVLSGPKDAATDAQIREQLLLQVYEPARMFGEPVRSSVLVTFSGVSVRG